MEGGTISLLLFPLERAFTSLFFLSAWKESGVMTENKYQAGLIRRLKRRFPGCEILKNDSGYRQGIPDLTLFYGPCWAVLEVKDHATAAERPNQAYYVQRLNDMSFGAFIFPENEEEVFTALQEAFASRGTPCFPQS
jgi:hypothetical protein